MYRALMYDKAVIHNHLKTQLITVRAIVDGLPTTTLSTYLLSQCYERLDPPPHPPRQRGCLSGTLVLTVAEGKHASIISQNPLQRTTRVPELVLKGKHRPSVQCPPGQMSVNRA